MRGIAKIAGALAGTAALSVGLTACAGLGGGDENADPTTPGGGRTPDPKDGPPDATPTPPPTPPTQHKPGLPADVLRDLERSIALLKRSHTGRRLLRFWHHQHTRFHIMPLQAYGREMGETDSYGTESENHIWMPYRTLRDARDGAATIAHELTHAVQDTFDLFSRNPKITQRQTPWSPPPVRLLRHRPNGMPRDEFIGLQAEAQAFIVEARVAAQAGFLRRDKVDNFAIARDNRIKSMQRTFRDLGRSSAYGSYYERLGRSLQDRTHRTSQV